MILAKKLLICKSWIDIKNTIIPKNTFQVTNNSRDYNE